MYNPRSNHVFESRDAVILGESPAAMVTVPENTGSTVGLMVFSEAYQQVIADGDQQDVDGSDIDFSSNEH